MLIALGAIVLGGCGGSSHSTSSPPTGSHPAATAGLPPPNLISTKQIDAYPRGSAARALLELWQAVQFSDVESAQQRVAPGALTRLTPTRFASMVQTIGDNIPGLQILNQTSTGPDVSVRVYLLFYNPNRAVASTAPLSFALSRGPNGYQLNDLSYFLRTEQAIVAAQRKASHR